MGVEVEAIHLVDDNPTVRHLPRGHDNSASTRPGSFANGKRLVSDRHPALNPTLEKMALTGSWNANCHADAVGTRVHSECACVGRNGDCGPAPNAVRIGKELSGNGAQSVRNSWQTCDRRGR
jgi:hypothetical protein